MAFFNLTQLGLQDTIKNGVRIPAAPIATGPVPGTQSENQLPVRTGLKEPVYPNSEANGSYVKYTERLHKHIRPQKGPNEIYDKKVSNNYTYGWWMRDGVQKEQWTKNTHHPMVRSEMTRQLDIHGAVALLLVRREPSTKHQFYEFESKHI